MSLQSFFSECWTLEIISKFENFDIPGPEFDALNCEKTVELVSGIGFKCTI